MTSTAVDKRLALRRSIVIWAGLLLLLLAALFSAIGILSRELYSATAFVRIYLDAVADRDVDAALGMPGLYLGSGDPAGTGSAVLVAADAMGGITDIALVSDTEIEPGRHRVVYSYRLTGLDGHSAHGQSEFDVVQTGTTWLFFSTWRFFEPPTATAAITVSHAADFTAGALHVEAPDPAAFHSTGDYEVLVPGLYVLSHSSPYLGARSVALAATGPATTVPAIVDVEPTVTFVDAVQSQVDSFLDDCAAETLLYPPGCPFGLDVDDRITNEPAWSIESYPAVTLIAGQDAWVVPSAAGSAQVSVDVRSLYDGTVSNRTESVPFTVSFSLSIAADGSVAFAPRS